VPNGQLIEQLPAGLPLLHAVVDQRYAVGLLTT
jgi:hypothetical protein